MTSVRFRDAVLSDLPDVVSLLADDPLGSTRESNQRPLPEAYATAFRALQEQSGNRLIVAVDDNENVLGCMQLIISPGIVRLGMTRATIEGVRISKLHRAKGLGTKLIEHAISIAKDAGCGLVQLTTDSTRDGANEFYERLGFIPSHVGMKLHL